MNGGTEGQRIRTAPGGTAEGQQRQPETGRLAPGTVLQDRYRILREHEQGGSATLYLAERLGIDEPVTLAIKELHPAAVASLDVKTEVQLLFQLSHPNLPKIYDFFEAGGRYYLVMDYLEGTPLDLLVRQRGRLSEAEALDYALQVASIFAYLHGQERRIIHRDLKPANLIVDKRGQVKLIDFGIARVLGGRRRGASIHAYTEHYSAPEQRENLRSDERSDVYSFGATLHFMLTGEPPPEPQAATGRRRRARQPTWHLGAIIQKCMDPDPQARYPTFQALEQDLLAYLELKQAGGTVEAALRRRRSVGARIAAWSWGQRVAAFLILAAVVGGAAVGGVYAYRQYEAYLAAQAAPVPVLGAEDMLLGDRILLQVNLPERRVRPGQELVWEVYDVQRPHTVLRTYRGAMVTFEAPAVGRYRFHVLLEGTPVAVPKEVTVRQGFGFVGPDGKPQESLGPVVPGYRVQLVPDPPAVLPDPGRTGLPGKWFCWQWTVTDPAGQTERLVAQELQVELRFAQPGTYTVAMTTLVQPPTRPRAAGCLAEGDGVLAVDGGSREVEVRAITPVGLIRNINTSFEQFTGGQPAGWSLLGNPQVRLDDTVARTGRWSVRFTGPITSEWAHALQAVATRPATRYRITAWVRGHDVRDGTVILLARFRSTRDESYVMVDRRLEEPVEGTFEWRQVMLLVEIPPDRQPWLELYLKFLGRGTVWFDDVVVEEL